MASDHSAFAASEYPTHETSTPSRADREPSVAELKQHNAMLLTQLYETTAWFQKENAELQRQVGTLQRALEKSHRELELVVAANAALQAALYPNTTTPGNH